jgi:hypothetical protein
MMQGTWMDFTGEAGDALLMVTVDDRERRTNTDVTSQDTDFFLEMTQNIYAFCICVDQHWIRTARTGKLRHRGVHPVISPLERLQNLEANLPLPVTYNVD